jgi:hypothetical protein
MTSSVHPAIRPSSAEVDLLGRRQQRHPASSGQPCANCITRHRWPCSGRAPRSPPDLRPMGEPASCRPGTRSAAARSGPRPASRVPPAVAPADQPAAAMTPTSGALTRRAQHNGAPGSAAMAPGQISVPCKQPGLKHPRSLHILQPLQIPWVKFDETVSWVGDSAQLAIPCRKDATCFDG